MSDTANHPPATGDDAFVEPPARPRYYLPSAAATPQHPAPTSGERVLRKRIEAERRLQDVIARANQVGIDQARLRQIAQTMEGKSGSLMRYLPGYFINEWRLDTDPANVLQLARRYQTETIRNREPGELNHYHQTTVDNFASIVAHGMLMSDNELRARGITRKERGSGSRPDAVLFTRDKYDPEGNLRETGLLRASSIGASSGVALIFPESIMDDPEYDPLDMYPSMPRVPLSKLAAVAVQSEADVLPTQSLLAEHGFSAPVYTREQWTGMR